MCCLLTTLILFGSRAAILVWWLFDTARWQAAFDSFFWPLLGFIFLPWTTLMYVAVFPGGISWFDWFFLAFAVVADIAAWAGGGYGNRDRMPGYGTTTTTPDYTE